MKETLTEQEYLETFVKELHNEIELDKQKAFMHKKMYGTWTAEEIINAMKSICPEAWGNKAMQSRKNNFA
jgi:hypothetical protein